MAIRLGRNKITILNRAKTLKTLKNDKGLHFSGLAVWLGSGSHTVPRENEVRERIPVPHDNYLKSIISSRPHCKGYFCLWFP